MGRKRLESRMAVGFRKSATIRPGITQKVRPLFNLCSYCNVYGEKLQAFRRPSLTTAGMVFGFRMALWVLGGNGELSEGIRQVAPGALFYLAYGLSPIASNAPASRVRASATSIR